MEDAPINIPYTFWRFSILGSSQPVSHRRSRRIHFTTLLSATTRSPVHPGSSCSIGLSSSSQRRQHASCDVVRLLARAHGNNATIHRRAYGRVHENMQASDGTCPHCLLGHHYCRARSITAAEASVRLSAAVPPRRNPYACRENPTPLHPPRGRPGSVWASHRSTAGCRPVS